MAYPGISDWMNGAPLTAWFQKSNGSTLICSTTGWELLRDLQEELQSRVSSGSFASFDGSTVDASTVPINDPLLISVARGWDASLLKALWAVANSAHAPSAYLDAVRADALSPTGSVSPTTLSTGIWVAEMYRGIDRNTGNDVYGVGSPADARLPVAITTPRKDQAPPQPTARELSSGLYCNTPSDTVSAIQNVGGGYTPFQINPWVALGVIAVVGISAAYLFNIVPSQQKLVR